MDDFPPIVSLDWKFPGVDYLGFFPERYVDLGFFKSDAFEALQDHCATRMPEEVFDALSAFLAPHGYALWNLNTGSDEYNLFVAQDTDADTLAIFQLAQNMSETEGFPCEVERLGGGAEFSDEAVEEEIEEDVAPTSKKKTKSGVSIIAESIEHLEYGGLKLDETPIQLLEEEGNAGASKTLSLVNTNVWPAENVSADGFLSQMATLAPYILYGSDAVQFWQVKHDAKRNKIVSITDYEKPTLDDLAGEPYASLALQEYAGFGDTFYFFVRKPPGFLKTLFKRTEYDEPNPLQDLMMARSGRIRYVATITVPSVILPLSETEVLVFFSNEFDQLIAFVRVDVNTKVVGPKVVIPGGPAAAPFLINEDEIGFIQTTELELTDYYGVTEKTGYLCRYSLRSGELKRAKLEGLHNSSKLSLDRNKPKEKLLWQSFEGFIRPSQGHEGWFILNYMTNRAGPTALAWLWNSADNEIVKITTKDFPRELPTLHYNKALDRYLADQSCRLDLLIPFEDIHRTREKGKLVWD
jgi:hypothetical protein